MKNSKRIKDNAIFFLLSVLSILFLVPIIIVFINSFKSRIYISSEPLKLPTSETFVGLENYINGIASSDFIGIFSLTFYYRCKCGAYCSFCFYGGLVYCQS